MPLTRPLSATELTAVLPDETRGLNPATVHTLLRTMERTLRATFNVEGIDADTNEALADAMIAGFASYRKQLSQVESIQTGANAAGERYGMAITWPAVVGSILRPFATDKANLQDSLTTRLVRG